MTIVKYREYEDFDNRRVEINNALMALLAGSQLAAHVLRLTDGSQLTLKEIFPNVPQIGRVNLRPDLAQKLLNEAEVHLGTMAVPYVLALHEDYMSHCMDELQTNRIITGNSRRGESVSNIHSRFATATGSTLPAESIEILNILRLIRNSHIHRGGVANSELATASSRLSSAGQALWAHLCKAPLNPIAKGQHVQLTRHEMVATLATTKYVSETVNHVLVQACPRGYWADKLVSECSGELNLGAWNRGQRIKKAHGYARMRYTPLAFSAQDIDDALKRAGW